ncbi:hypothetical protein BGM19_34985 [Streptomyces agglomeratus]|uniref:hypothetical protein n=1 Tax=Streptomyces agglomeratus TaxID=285458 RepID=UPI00086DBE57|nr:hypothetical protein [Streptomyces agglomeratus]OEJ62438.1 hypothetical protein BGM19_34985 [Streptomyces agglomeratus]
MRRAGSYRKGETIAIVKDGGAGTEYITFWLTIWPFQGTDGEEDLVVSWSDSYILLPKLADGSASEPVRSTATLGNAYQHYAGEFSRLPHAVDETAIEVTASTGSVEVALAQLARVNGKDAVGTLEYGLAREKHMLRFAPEEKLFIFPVKVGEPGSRQIQDVQGKPVEMHGGVPADAVSLDSTREHSQTIAFDPDSGTFALWQMPIEAAKEAANVAGNVLRGFGG